MIKTLSTRRGWLLILLLWSGACALAIQNILQQGGFRELFTADTRAIPAILLQTLWAPRQCMALVAGATLGVCGWLMQRVLRNPLAEPTTLGMTSGATLAMGLASMWFPASLLTFRTGIVILGEVGALACVLMLAWRQRLSPLVMIQAGMMINLWCGAVTMLIAVVNDRFLLAAMMWTGGSLAQEGWQTFFHLLPWLGGGLLALLLMSRQLELLQLPETMVSSLGASPFRIRAMAMTLALLMSAMVINAVGVISFIGLAAPHLARLCGARTSRETLWQTAFIGAGLLWFTDLCASRIAIFNGQLLPAGMLTALIGGPLLILLARRTRAYVIDTAPLPIEGPAFFTGRRAFGWALVVLIAATVVSLFFGRSLHDWHLATLQELNVLLPLRLPRLLAAICAGALLAGAGVLMQRVSGNPLASPEVLGIGGGAVLGITVVVALFPTSGNGMLLLSSTLGALISLGITLWNSQQSAFNPQRVLLNGLALNALCQAVVNVVMLHHLESSAKLLPLMSGTTYYVNAPIAGVLLVVTLVLLAIAPLFRRWLVLLPMGGVAASLGLGVPKARVAVLSLAALMTGFATLLVGPVSFVGLLGPHLARRLGVKDPLAQLFTAALLSALVMVAADWLGRNALFPRQLPVGLVASLVGVPLLIWPLLRSRASGPH